MALAKEGYATQNIASTSVKVNLNANGTIAQEGETVVGTKRINIAGVNIDNGLTSNTAVLEVFVNYFGGGTQDSLSNTMSAKWEVES